MNTISILLVGDLTGREFREASASLVDLGQVTNVLDAEAAATALAEGRSCPT